MRLIFKSDQITAGGVYQELYRDEVILTAGTGFGKLSEGGHWLKPSEDYGIPYLLELISNGVEVNEMPVVVLAPVAILDQQVFEGLPFRTDENGQVIKFSQWGNNPLLVSADGTQCLILCTVNGRYLNGSEWAVFADHPELVLMDREEKDNLILQNPEQWQEQ